MLSLLALAHDLLLVFESHVDLHTDLPMQIIYQLSGLVRLRHWLYYQKERILFHVSTQEWGKFTWEYIKI